MSFTVTLCSSFSFFFQNFLVSFLEKFLERRRLLSPSPFLLGLGLGLVGEERGKFLTALLMAAEILVNAPPPDFEGERVGVAALLRMSRARQRSASRRNRMVVDEAGLRGKEAKLLQESEFGSSSR